ncbi:hypothetical protein LXL04_002094 [Taraxacum kok-saghyz]
MDHTQQQVVIPLKQQVVIPLKLTGKKIYLEIKLSITIAIEHIGIKMPSIFDFQLGDGKDVRFWYDWWAGDECLANQFPDLVVLDRKKSTSVAERIGLATGGLCWKKKPYSVDEIEQLNSLLRIIDNKHLNNSPDKLISRLNTEGKFHVSDFRQRIDVLITQSMHNNKIWMHLVPPKISCFIWRVCIGRIPTSIELSKRGINISNPSCRQCLDGVDDTDHNFVACPFARGVLSRIWNWCHISD